MKAEYNQGPDHDYYNNPAYITTNKEAEPYFNYPRMTVETGLPSAEEREAMLEEEICQLMNTNRTL